MGFLFKVI